MHTFLQSKLLLLMADGMPPFPSPDIDPVDLWSSFWCSYPYVSHGVLFLLQGQQGHSFYADYCLFDEEYFFDYLRRPIHFLERIHHFHDRDVGGGKVVDAVIVLAAFFAAGEGGCCQNSPRLDQDRGFSSLL